VTIRYDDLGRILKTLPDHPRPVYEIEADFRFDVPVLGTVRVPVRERREIPLPSSSSGSRRSCRIGSSP